jgi:hypothetical protein
MAFNIFSYLLLKSKFIVYNEIKACNLTKTKAPQKYKVKKSYTYKKVDFDLGFPVYFPVYSRIVDHNVEGAKSLEAFFKGSFKICVRRDIDSHELYVLGAKTIFPQRASRFTSLIYFKNM